MVIEKNLRIVLFTVLPSRVGSLQEIFAERGHRLVGILTAPGPRSRRTDGYLGVAQHARPGLDVIVSNYPGRWADMIRPLRPDLLFCAAFNWRIPADVLAVPRLGAMNGHDSLLPKYRGRNATGWTLRNDEPALGSSLHRMTPDFDDGPILAQRSVPITDEDDIDTLVPRVWAQRRDLIHEALEKIEGHDPGVPQDESQATYAGGLFEPEWRSIDWNRPARDVLVQVRSWYGAREVPRGAFGEIDGRQMLITKTRLSTCPSNSAPPGTVIDYRHDGSLVVQCADGPLEIVGWLEAAEEYAAWRATMRESLEAT